EDVLILRHICEALGHEFFRGPPGDFERLEPNAASRWPQNSDDGLHEGRFATSVWPDDHDELAIVDDHRDAVEDFRFPVASIEVFHLEENVLSPRGRNRSPLCSPGSPRQDLRLACGPGDSRL